ncbi:MAG: ketopantoate reductase family protein [Chloroflexota bacterium]
MRVLVMGSGGVGGFYGAALAHSGHDVTFVARGPHLKALRERGLEVRSGGQVRVLNPVSAIASPADASGEFDLVLFTVKTYDTDAAAEALKPVVGSNTAILPLQNGVESVERLSPYVGAAHVLAGTTIIIARIVGPGVIEETGPLRRITFGDPSGDVTPRLEAIATALREAGVDVIVSRDTTRTLWEKFAPLAAHATITSACGTSLGPIRDLAEGKDLYRTMIREASQVGRAAGAALPAEFEDGIFAFLMSIPPDAQSSLQRDYERRHRVELEQLTGTIVRLGRELGVATPSFDALYPVLKVRALAFDGLN